ncbi:CAP domain-containing protein [Caballeronia sp. LjRoot31]|uniref:CAP domain-containing protein n=1 Tax=Caballeronia sp. LjRoot31 TaxID=3342324 RepID=UPI003ED0C494
MNGNLQIKKCALYGAIFSTAILAACGGGGGGGSSSTAAATSASSTTATSGNVSTPQYAASSAQLAAFQLLNQERQQCGFAALTENTTLDQPAQAHATYMGENSGLITDTEVSGNPGFTGVTYTDRAVHFGYPSTVLTSGVSGGYYTNATLTPTQYGQQLVYGWLSGVYHIAIGVWPVTEVGVGWNQTTYNGFPEIQASLEIGNMQTGTGSGPLTFPCQGTTGVAYSAGGETPTPPNTSGNWGTPIALAGLSQNDTLVLQSGTMTDTSGNVINLQLLYSANDPNKELPSFEAVAYPTTPLQPNATYSVSITGTDNGTAFSRSFTFTTGSVVG